MVWDVQHVLALVNSLISILTLFGVIKINKDNQAP